MLELRSVVFGGDDYVRMADVLRKSVELNSPHTPITLHYVHKPLIPRAKRLDFHNASNVTKTLYHTELVHLAKDGQLLGLLDCDTLVLGDLSEIETKEFDIAFTFRNDRSPINTGVVFLRVSDKVRDFYWEWLAEVQRLAFNHKKLLKLNEIYRGVNQSALNEILRERDFGLKILELPCEIYNSVSCTWRYFSKNTKILHVLGRLRHAALRGAMFMDPCIMRLANLWRQYEKQLKLPCGNELPKVRNFQVFSFDHVNS